MKLELPKVQTVKDFSLFYLDSDRPQTYYTIIPIPLAANHTLLTAQIRVIKEQKA